MVYDSCHFVTTDTNVLFEKSITFSIVNLFPYVITILL